MFLIINVFNMYSILFAFKLCKYYSINYCLKFRNGEIVQSNNIRNGLQVSWEFYQVKDHRL